VKSEIADYHPPGTGPFDSRGNYIESWADKPSRWRGRSVPTPPKNMPTKPTEPAPQVASTTPPPPPSIASTSRPPAPKPAAKPKPKPKPVKVKPKTRRITVQKGDTLYGLARRYGSSVAKIKSVNGLKSDLIKPGQRLTIPR
jgi:LysM repeat protein